jgi:hypothetical protein
MTISRGLEKELRSMERRVEILVNESMKEDTPPVLELFDDADEPSSAE